MTLRTYRSPSPSLTFIICADTRSALVIIPNTWLYLLITQRCRSPDREGSREGGGGVKGGGEG